MSADDWEDAVAAHAGAARRLAEQLGWDGTFLGGDLDPNTKVWVNTTTQGVLCVDRFTKPQEGDRVEP
jgi:hypothetical protein